MSFHFPGPVGDLEGIHELPEASADPTGAGLRGAAVVCHPHPLHGGTMRNTIVFRAARALRANGLATLRFNFRGVEGSEGKHDGTGGEELDVAAGLDYLEAQHPGVPLWAVGYSFGSRTVSGRALKDPRIEHVVLIALPVSVYDCSFVERVEQPGFALFGSADEFGTVAELREKHPSLFQGTSRLEIDEIEGADHFFRGRTPILEEKIHDHVRSALGVSP